RRPRLPHTQTPTRRGRERDSPTPRPRLAHTRPRLARTQAATRAHPERDSRAPRARLAEGGSGEEAEAGQLRGRHGLRVGAAARQEPAHALDRVLGKVADLPGERPAVAGLERLAHVAAVDRPGDPHDEVEDAVTLRVVVLAAHGLVEPERDEGPAG